MSDDGNITDLPTDHRKRLKRVKAGKFLRTKAPAQRWYAYPLIPAGTVTILSGDGGVGKSLLALQLAVSSALRSTWLDLRVRPGRSIYISAEDDIPDLHLRVEKIAAVTKLGFGSDIDDLTVTSLAGEDAVLASPNGPALRTTPLFQEIEEMIEEEKPALVVFDTLADMFAGDENQRSHARQFVTLLRGLCKRSEDLTVLLLAHPSVAGVQSGRGTSGSTGWSNSARSRLYLDYLKDQPDRRILQTMKANYARRGGRGIIVEWKDWFFAKVEPEAASEATPLAIADQPEAERTFLLLLNRVIERKDNVSDRPSSTYAPAVFVREPEGEKIGKKALQTAMKALLDRGAIQVRTVGSKRRNSRRLGLPELAE